jgi:hypothetical protein
MAAAKLRHMHPTAYHVAANLEAEASKGHSFDDVLAHRDLCLR